MSHELCAVRLLTFAWLFLTGRENLEHSQSGQRDSIPGRNSFTDLGKEKVFSGLICSYGRKLSLVGGLPVVVAVYRVKIVPGFPDSTCT